jgi:predicted DNA-binding transcriptional regulator AlpA
MSEISAAIAALEPPPPASLTLRGPTVAKLLGVHIRTLVRNPDKFPKPAFGTGKLRRWLRADVEKFLTQRAAELQDVARESDRPRSV